MWYVAVAVVGCNGNSQDEFGSSTNSYKVRWSLTRDVPITLIRAFVIKKVDYCDSVLTDVSGNSLVASSRFWTLLLVLSLQHGRLAPLLMEELQWQKVPYIIRFRVWLCILAYRCLHGTAPAYITGSPQLSSTIERRRRLQSTDAMDLPVPVTCSRTLGDR